MFGHLLKRGAVPSIVWCGSSLATAQCGWFGRSSEEEEKKRVAAELKEKLGPMARLDLNEDGKVDEKDFVLAMQLAKEKVMVDAGAHEMFKSVGDEASKLLATGVPAQVSWGFCSGCCAGFAAKKVGKILAVTVGGVFCLLQALAYNGYITVDHDKIEKDFNSHFDINKDGSLDSSDLRVLYDKVYNVLNYNVPSGSGFAAGLILGLRSG